MYLNERASAPVRREEITPHAGDTQQEVGSQEMHVEVHQVLDVVDKLPLEQRAALLLMALENPGYREAARILDIKTGTLRSRLARAREAVRQGCEAERKAGAGERHLRRIK